MYIYLKSEVYTSSMCREVHEKERLVTMVTTNTNEIKDLFKTALEKTSELVSDTDTKEDDLLEQAYDLFRAAVRTVVPVIRYVEKEHIFGNEKPVRGVKLSVYYTLLRGGKIHSRLGPPKGTFTVSLEGFTISDNNHGILWHVDDLVDMINVLSNIFKYALEKIDQRRKSIAERSKQLQTASKAFD